MSLASAAIATAAACGHPAPAAEPTPPAVCIRISDAELAIVARGPSILDRPAARTKLDPNLSNLVITVERAARGEPWSLYDTNPYVPDGCVPATISVAIMHTGPDEQAFLDLGFKEGTRSRGIERSFAVGYISPARLLELAELPQVVSVRGPQQMWPELNDSIETVRVDRVRGIDPTATGADVVVAIIDSGLDWKHGSFRQRNGRTRVLGIWDQTEEAVAGETPGPTAGVVYTRDDIDHSLGHTVSGPAVKVRHRDKAVDESVQPNDPTSTGRGKLDSDEKQPHGTHVAGIAAGDGSPGSCCRPGGFRFVGMAPAADLLVVAKKYMRAENQNNLLAAFDWIEAHPGVVGKPIVVNISDGFNQGAHDGTTQLEQRIEDFVTPIPGQPTRVVVKSAGNEARTNRHIRAMVPSQGHVTVPLVAPKGARHATIALWFPHGGGLEFEFQVGGATTGRLDPAQNPKRSSSLPSGQPMSEQTHFHHDGAAAHADNGQGWMWFQIFNRGPFATDPLRIKVWNPTSTPVTFDAWIEKNGKDGVSFPAHDSSAPIRATRDGTITIPGTAPSVITVANGRGSLNADSSRGPVWRNAAANAKPTVTAPGDGVKSAEAGGNTCCVCLCGGPWVEMNGGTSMAAPHVTGIVALMLQKNKYLPLADIHTILRDHTIDGDHGDPNGWGAGRVDGLAAWQAVPVPAPPPSPTARLAPSTPATAAVASVITPRPAAVHPRPPDEAIAFHPVVALASTRSELVEIASLFSRHLSEVRRLINTNRRVATLWHRADGPQLLRRLGLGASDPTAPTPLRHRADRDTLNRLFEQLVRFGSHRLAASVRAHGPRVLTLLEAPLAVHRT